MSDIEYHKSLFAIIKENNTTEINSDYIELDYKPELIVNCTKLKIDTEVIQPKVRLICKSIKVKVFNLKKDFQKKQKFNTEESILIINNKTPLSYINGECFVNFLKKKNNFYFSNIKSYLEFVNELKDLEKESENGFHFVDSFKKDLRKITFINLSDKGRLDIKYEANTPNFKNSIDYSKGLNLFKDCFNEENNTLPKFLKSSLINLASNYNKKNRLKLIFENLDEIVSNSLINFEIYLNNLSIDKIKKEYDEIKSKYFKELSDILSKVTQKILVLPVGFAAILFSIYKVKEEELFLWMVLISILITSSYISILLKVNFTDLTYIKRIFLNDYKILTENNFFNKYPNEKNLFEEIKSRVGNRIKLLKIIIESYYFVLGISNITLVITILCILGFNFATLFIIFSTLLFFLIIFRNKVLNSNQN